MSIVASSPFSFLRGITLFLAFLLWPVYLQNPFLILLIPLTNFHHLDSPDSMSACLEDIPIVFPSYRFLLPLIVHFLLIPLTSGSLLSRAGFLPPRLVFLGLINRLPLIKQLVLNPDHRMALICLVLSVYPQDLNLIMAVSQKQLFTMYPLLNKEGNTPLPSFLAYPFL